MAKKKTWKRGQPAKTLEEVAAYFEKEGCRLLSTHYENNKSPLRYECGTCGRLRITCWNNFSRGRRCQFCNLKKLYGDGPEKRLQFVKLREQHFSIKDVADILNVNYDDFYNAVRVYKALPEPTHQLPGLVKCYYNEEDVAQIKELVEVIQ